MARGKKESQTKIVSRIVKRIKKERIPIRSISSKIGISSNSVYLFLRDTSCSVDRLWDYCKALDYNYFHELGKEIGIEEPRDPEKIKLQKALEVKEQELEDKEKEIKHLKEIIGVLQGEKLK